MRTTFILTEVRADGVWLDALQNSGLVCEIVIDETEGPHDQFTVKQEDLKLEVACPTRFTAAYAMQKAVAELWKKVVDVRVTTLDARGIKQRSILLSRFREVAGRADLRA